MDSTFERGPVREKKRGIVVGAGRLDGWNCEGRPSGGGKLRNRKFKGRKEKSWKATEH